MVFLEGGFGKVERRSHMHVSGSGYQQPRYPACAGPNPDEITSIAYSTHPSQPRGLGALCPGVSVVPASLLNTYHVY